MDTEQTVFNLDKGFGYNSDWMLEQQIIVLMNTSSERIFDRDYRISDLTAFNGGKNLFKGFKRFWLSYPERGDFTVCSWFLLGAIFRYQWLFLCNVRRCKPENLPD